MKAFPTDRFRSLPAFVLLCAALAAPVLRVGAAGPVVGQSTADASVAVNQDGKMFTLENGIVTARINKTNGDLENLVYKGIDTMGHDQDRAGYWEQDPSSAARSGGLSQSITIDPGKNGGERAEVSIKGVKKGGSQDRMMNCDLEIRYSLGRGDSGIYVYAIFSHPESYGPLYVPESRYITKINQTFDWISVDADRNMLECAPRDWGTGVVVHAKEQRIMSQGVYKNSVEHKYSYTAVQYKIPAFGWSSTRNHIGIWFINPTIEYLSGGASKQELVCHFGDNENPDPIILDYWRGSHYGGGAPCIIAAGEKWNKVIGPIFVYVNSLNGFESPSKAALDTLAATAGNPVVPAAWKDNATALWQDALNQAKRERSKWPYEWVNGVDYPHKSERGIVKGRLVLVDPQAATARLPHLTVGLAFPDSAQGIEDRQPGERSSRRPPVPADWAHDSKHYQFWNDGDEDGRFAISDIRPGIYTLHAFADGVLGEFSRTKITVEAGKTLDLGKVEWKPVRYGRQVWDIGYPDHTGGKFFKGDGQNYWLWGWGLRYPLLFPNDVTYTIGKSDYHKDWFFEQVPHGESMAWLNPKAKDPANQRFGWVREGALGTTGSEGPWSIYGRGRATTWTIKFNMDRPSQGYAVLRVALAGADTNELAVSVNGESVGAIHPMGTNALRYNTNKSVWQERDLKFDAAKLKAGENELQLTVPAGELTSGVVYDYLRLELNEGADIKAPPLAPKESPLQESR
jgi:rhamnogalacturonan endolyase